MKKYLIDNKELMKEWDYEKNKNINIDSITSGSSKKVWWICPNCNHKWKAAIYY